MVERQSQQKKNGFGPGCIIFLLLLESCSFASLMFQRSGLFALISKTVLCSQGLGSFQALAASYLTVASNQKIQPQEMRIWTWTGKSFEELAFPHLAAASYQIQPLEIRISAWQNFARFPQGHFSPSGSLGQGIVSKNLARIQLFCRLQTLRGATEQLLKDN